MFAVELPEYLIMPHLDLWHQGSVLLHPKLFYHQSAASLHLPKIQFEPERKSKSIIIIKFSLLWIQKAMCYIVGPNSKNNNSIWKKPPKTLGYFCLISDIWIWIIKNDSKAHFIFTWPNILLYCTVITVCCFVLNQRYSANYWAWLAMHIILAHCF